MCWASFSGTVWAWHSRQPSVLSSVAYRLLTLGRPSVALVPLYPEATRLSTTAPDLYDALTIVDVRRVGRARERRLAMKGLSRLILGLVMKG